MAARLVPDASRPRQPVSCHGAKSFPNPANDHACPIKPARAVALEAYFPPSWARAVSDGFSLFPIKACALPHLASCFHRLNPAGFTNRVGGAEPGEPLAFRREHLC